MTASCTSCCAIWVELDKRLSGTIQVEPAIDDVVEDILSSELGHPLRVVALHPNGTWRDVSAEIALALTKAAADSGDSPDQRSVGLRPYAAPCVVSSLKAC